MVGAETYIPLNSQDTECQGFLFCPFILCLYLYHCVCVSSTRKKAFVRELQDITSHYIQLQDWIFNFIGQRKNSNW